VDHRCETAAATGDREVVHTALPPRRPWGTPLNQATSEHPATTEQFYRAIDDLEERR
jgi:hypothetical protein